MHSESKRWKRELFSWAKTIALGIILALLVSNFLVVNASVISGSMENTLMTGERIFGNRLAYLFADPLRYDIVVFDFEEDGEVKQYVKRIIGLPGETVRIVDGKVFINDNDEPLPDDFVLEPPHQEDYGPFHVPQGQYFLLGDNRNNSYDSKSWDYHYIPQEQILGKLVLAYYPRVHLVQNAPQS